MAATVCSHGLQPGARRLWRASRGPSAAQAADAAEEWLTGLTGPAGPAQIVQEEMDAAFRTAEAEAQKKYTQLENQVRRPARRPLVSEIPAKNSSRGCAGAPSCWVLLCDVFHPPPKRAQLGSYRAYEKNL